MDRGFSQPQVAKALKVATDTVTYWETNRCEPTTKFAKRVIEFLGYVPFYEGSQNIGEKLRITRIIIGKAQAEVVEKIGMDESNLRWIELGTRKPFQKTREKIEKFVEEVLRV